LNNGFGQRPLQKEHLFITAYGPEEGLRQSMVSQVIQDRDGLIWMTTGDGLHCFDGNEFKVFRMPFKNIYKHADNLMRDMACLNTGRLTISSNSSILDFNTTKGEFDIIYRKEGSFPELLKTREAEKPLAWLPDQKLCLVNKGKLIPLKLSFSNNSIPPPGFIAHTSVRYGSKELLLAGNQGFISVRLDKSDMNKVLRSDWIPVKNCQDISEDRSGRVFILTGGKIKQYLGSGKVRDFYDTRIAEDLYMFIDSRNNIWLSEKSNDRFFRLSDGIMKEISFLMLSGKHIDSITPNIRCSYEDNHGNLWFGTDGNGVLRYSPDQIHFERASIGFTRCMTWYNNSLWAGTYNNGLWKLSPDLSKSERILPEKFHNEMYFLDLQNDRAGRLWVASRKGIFVLGSSGEIVFNYDYNCSNAKFLNISFDSILVLCDNQLIKFHLLPKISFINSEVFLQVSAFISTKDSYWLGTPFGLYRGPKETEFDKYKLFNPANHLMYNQVYSLLHFRGNIWAGTGNGIEIYTMAGEPIPQNAAIRELQNDIIYSMIPDNMGSVWFTCNQGIGCILPDNDHVVYFNAGNNLQSLEFNYNASCRSPDGKIYFGGIHGINGFEPSRFRKDKDSPEVRMIELFVGDTSFTKGIPPRFAGIRLNRKAPHISGKVYCTDVTDAGTQLYSFLLEGYQQKWSKPSTFPDFSYRDLPPGEYRLLAKSADVWHNWSEPVVLLSVSLKPPYWKTGWFLFITISIITTITALIVKKINAVRFGHKIRELEQQHAIEKERLRISKDMHDEVGASLTRISILGELAKKQTDQPVKLQEAISKISEIAGNVVDEMSEIIWAMNPKNDHLDSFAAYIRQYSSTYLEPTEIKVIFDFPDHVTAIPMSSEIRRNLFLTIKEALHNIVKHSGAGTVNMTMLSDKSVLKVSISDNGKGFDLTRAKGSGNGLHNMQRRVEESGGKYQIIPEPGKGTAIEITIALEINHTKG